jgi:hypothetical protein
VFGIITGEEGAITSGEIPSHLEDLHLCNFTNIREHTVKRDTPLQTAAMSNRSDVKSSGKDREQDGLFCLQWWRID